MNQNIPELMASGVFRVIFSGCILFILASAMIWIFDLIPVTG
ncbi:MAG: hypothetical protein QGE97_04445 [SAR324 cluster bacterium]|nr:hypothetical protein [SAR324 cluster bacterium]